MGQYYSMSYPRATLRFTMGCLTLAAPSGLVYRQIQVYLTEFIFLLSGKRQKAEVFYRH